MKLRVAVRGTQLLIAIRRKLGKTEWEQIAVTMWLFVTTLFPSLNHRALLCVICQ